MLVLVVQYWQTLKTKEQNVLLHKNLSVNTVEFELELDEGLYRDTDVLQLLKYLCQNKNNCLFIYEKIIIIIKRLIKIYLIE